MTAEVVKTENGDIMNFISIIGNIVSKPQLSVHGELKYTRFSIAVNSYAKGEKRTEFFDVVAFGKNAENICNLDKGYTLPICGHLHQDVYTNRDGKKVSSVCIYLDAFTYVSNKKDTETKTVDVSPDGFVPFN